MHVHVLFFTMMLIFVNIKRACLPNYLHVLVDKPIYVFGNALVYRSSTQTSANNQKVLMLPMEATGLMGTLAGIGEISKEVFGQEKSAPAAKSAGTRRTVPAARDRSGQ